DTPAGDVLPPGGMTAIDQDEQPELEWCEASRPAEIPERLHHLRAKPLPKRCRIDRQQRGVQALRSHDAFGNRPRFRAARTIACRRSASSRAASFPLRV